MRCVLAGHHLTSFVLIGLGYASQVMILHSCVYYIVILAWALFYLGYSFQAELPWSHCNNTWNTGQRRQSASLQVFETTALLFFNILCPPTETCILFTHQNQTVNSSLLENATSPVMEFWE